VIEVALTIHYNTTMVENLPLRARGVVVKNHRHSAMWESKGRSSLKQYREKQGFLRVLPGSPEFGSFEGPVRFIFFSLIGWYDLFVVTEPLSNNVEQT
jgi:hypothetical protein